MKTKCEAPALGAAVQRMLKALVRRADEGDTEALEQLMQATQTAERGVADALHGMRERGYSLAELSRVTGTSRPAVLKRSRRADAYYDRHAHYEVPYTTD